jgi:hypothetical protein
VFWRCARASLAYALRFQVPSDLGLVANPQYLYCLDICELCVPCEVQLIEIEQRGCLGPGPELFDGIKQRLRHRLQLLVVGRAGLLQLLCQHGLFGLRGRIGLDRIGEGRCSLIPVRDEPLQASMGVFYCVVTLVMPAVAPAASAATMVMVTGSIGRCPIELASSTPSYAHGALGASSATTPAVNRAGFAGGSSS